MPRRTDPPQETLHVGTPHPVPDGRAETLFGTLANRCGPQIAATPTQEMFELAIRETKPARQPENKLDQILVQKRRAGFKPVGHGGAVNFDQDVSGKITTQIEIRRAIKAENL